jgi:hypothetical protein
MESSASSSWWNGNACELVGSSEVRWGGELNDENDDGGRSEEVGG